jgi:hypothetical protein
MGKTSRQRLNPPEAREMEGILWVLTTPRASPTLYPTPRALALYTRLVLDPFVFILELPILHLQFPVETREKVYCNENGLSHASSVPLFFSDHSAGCGGRGGWGLGTSDSKTPATRNAPLFLPRELRSVPVFFFIL